MSEKLLRNILSDINLELTDEFYQNYGAKISSTGITFQSDAPSAALHNKGGKITVTAKKKRFFWAMYYSETGAI